MSQIDKAALAIAMSHSSQHKAGGTDELAITDLSGYSDLDSNLNTRGLIITDKRFGAKGGGVNDTAAIQAAIDAAAQGAGIVVLPQGVFDFTELHLKSNVRIVGAGRDRTILHHIGTDKAIFNSAKGAEVSNAGLSDFTVRMNPSTTIAIEYARVYQSIIENVHIDAISAASTATGISFDDGTVHASYYNSCYDVSINGVIANGFLFQNNANSNRLINCRTNQCKNGANIANYCDNVLLMGCSFELFTVGVTIKGPSNQVIGCRFENAGAAPNGTAILIDYANTFQSNLLIGNPIINVATVLRNMQETDPSAPYGNNFIFNYSRMSVKFLQHEPDGGWLTPQNMNNWGIRQAGFLDMWVRTVDAGEQEGRIHYAPSSAAWVTEGKGLYIHDGATHRKIGMKRPVPANAGTLGNPGDYASDANYYYYCYAPNQWRRVAGTAF